jgi:hypothetical protein
MRSAIRRKRPSRDLSAVHASAQTPDDLLVVVAAKPAHSKTAHYSNVVPGSQCRTKDGGRKYPPLGRSPLTSIITRQGGDVILNMVSVPSYSSSMLRYARSLRSVRRQFQAGTAPQVGTAPQAPGSIDGLQPNLLRDGGNHHRELRMCLPLGDPLPGWRPSGGASRVTAGQPIRP